MESPCCWFEASTVEYGSSTGRVRVEYGSSGGRSNTLDAKKRKWTRKRKRRKTKEESALERSSLRTLSRSASKAARKRERDRQRDSYWLFIRTGRSGPASRQTLLHGDKLELQAGLPTAHVDIQLKFAIRRRERQRKSERERELEWG